MAHELETMMYAREVPWHGLGIALPAEVNAAEAMQYSQLDWEVEQRTLYTQALVNGPRITEIADRKAIVRCSDDSVLGIASPQYKPLQNSEAFEFFDQIVGSGQAIYHTAGSLRGGRRIWILAKLPQTAAVKGVDPVNNYLLLMNGHDGSMALRMHWTPIRVVCWNTLQLALGRQTGSAFYARHTEGITQRVKEAKEMLGFAVNAFDGFMAQAERIASMSYLKADLDNFLKEVLEFDPAKLDEEQTRGRKAAFSRINELVEVGAGLQQPEIRGTRWAVYNAITEYIDHERPTTAQGGRLDVAWFGAGQDIKARAWELIQN